MWISPIAFALFTSAGVGMVENKASCQKECREAPAPKLSPSVASFWHDVTGTTLLQAGELVELGSARAAVRPSGLAGAGLGAFARRSYTRGQLVGEYLCEITPVRNVPVQCRCRSACRRWPSP